jgi:hypothetical protein
MKGPHVPAAALDGRAALLATLTEKEWQAQVVAWAHRAGWRVYHVADSRRSAAGFPDLVLVRPPQILLVELKTIKGRISPQQRIWLDELGQCSKVATLVWRPDMESIVKESLGL